MSRRLAACLGATALAVAAELAPRMHDASGHWPIGMAAAVGLGGALLLTLGAKALGGRLQRTDPGDAAGAGEAES